ncbi:MAG: hypothetical protein R6V37_05575 [Psychroflexus maritimus]
MAKIKSIIIEAEDSITLDGGMRYSADVKLEVEFHPIDLIQKMEYAVLISLFNIKGKRDVSQLLPNWDETQILEIEKAFNDIALAQTRTYITAEKGNEVFSKTLNFKLNYKNYSCITSLKIDAIAYLVPAISTAGKWSLPKHIDLLH